VPNTVPTRVPRKVSVDVPVLSSPGATSLARSAHLDARTTVKPARRVIRTAALWAVVGLGVIPLGVWVFRGARDTSQPAYQAVPLTSDPGFEEARSFSPDGSQVAAGTANLGLSVSHDRRYVLYAETDVGDSDLMLVDGFR
jgi:hypothetical protein